MNKDDKYFMKCAIRLAKLAEVDEEVPVGAVLVLNNIIIGHGSNSSISKHDPTAHAEIIAFRAGGTVLKNYRLLNTTLYVTLEPCFMCYGAIIHSRISRLVFGASYNNKNDYFCLNNDLLRVIKKNNITVTKNILKKECRNILKNFFWNKRKK
ncbi:tRNA adenosine(34) deaminase TadA [Buchnera aphidicola]|uniref:tRNA-specific adenosine deaminase n=1 Tax=Buchnera aphidicola subsp. Melaphis rhois TaxID=118103 RepID=A0A4D6YG08_BUCMH|nr:tRNA adenosine(34) deaminase TadA [Buchnera aphidicola]QCI23265.1 tRNA adenosine(34) deaminase TadA [Buchnera aphidicola (Melaphis rhois)]